MDTRSGNLIGLAAFLAASFAVAAIGGWATAGSVGTWYAGLAKPAFNPPNAVFGPVWTVLYILIAIAGWRVWLRAGVERAGTLALFGVQLGLNLAWSLIFFGAHLIGAALIDILLLLASILILIFRFSRIDRLAMWMFVPYALWVSFATALNARIWILNR